MKKLLLFDFDDVDVHRLISSGAGLNETFRTLHPDPAAFSADEDKWITQYRQVYTAHGQPLIKSYPGAKEILEHLKASNIAVAIISNKGVSAVKTALENNGLFDCLPAEFIIGDNTPGAMRKPHPGSFEDVLVPLLIARGVQVEPKDVLVVGDTVADLKFAGNIGCRACWCRYGYGDKKECQDLKPAFTVDSLVEIKAIIMDQ
ncbi:HAD-like protein [Microthyrium microscopicum]|uniref:HAD-like protein n=1 Tax=Microthyrium microscopicum TaxID=703497 RepID=A0A6A6TZF9_9PEZI|nr:HAD-like protein [Microthyrium microscopicum]